MILKTAVHQLDDPQLNNGTEIWHHRNGFYKFRCGCSEWFRLRDTNSFTSWDDIRCSDCKRISRLKEHIGERYVFKRVKWDAKKAGRSFNLSFEWFKEIIHQPCHYCNRKDTNKVNVASKIPGEFLLTDFRYNGIDRVDNAVGYEEDNCIPCCVVCNRAKNSMPYDEFMEYIRSLVNYQSSVGDYNVIDKDAVHSARVPYRGRHRKTGNDIDLEEPPAYSISVSNNRSGKRSNLPSRIEWTRGLHGGPYREIERIV